jgi:hypothetical protein
MGEAFANVILRIGSKLGPGGLSSLKAGWDMLKGFSNSITNSVKELDKFKIMMDQVDMSVINFADSAAKGQIDTAELMRGLQKLNESGAKVTKEQFKTLAVQVVNHSKAVGKDATPEWERLTTAISRGSSRALTEYGIRLKESTDLQKTQKEAIRGLTEGFEDLNVEITTGSERLYQLSNNWGTFKSAVWSAIGDVPLWADAIDSINDVLGETVKALTESTKATRDWAFQWENLREIVIPTLQMLGGLLTGNITPAVASYAARFKNLIKKGLSDEDLQKANAAELEKRKQEKNPRAKPIRRGSGKTLAEQSEEWGSETPGEGLKSFFDYGVDIFDATLLKAGEFPTNRKEFEEIQKRKYGKLGYGGPPVTSGRDFAGAAEAVDQRMAEADAELKIVEAHERRLQLVTDEFEIRRQINELNDEELIQMQESAVQRRARLELVTSEEYHEARLKELREDEQVYQAERQIELEFAREKALDFAQQFGDVWAAAMDRISAGGMAADGVLNVMKGTWAAIVTAAIEGHNGIGQAIRETIKAVGIQIAIEAGLMALLSAGRAIYYAATRQYASATKAGLAAASFAATAVVAGVAAATASAFGKSAKSIKPVSIPSSSSASSSTSSYGGAYSGEQPMRQEVIIRLAPDAGSQMFEVVQQQNTMARRSGTTSFTEDAA